MPTAPCPAPAEAFHVAFDAVVFDLDGTLIDTEALCNEAGVAACALLGHPVSMAFFEGLAGIHDIERARLIGQQVGAEIDVDRLFSEWDRLCNLRFAKGIPVKPGAHDLLDRLGAMGLPLGLATSSRRGPALHKIEVSGLTRYFRTIVTVDDVEQAKPAPEAYLLAARNLGADPVRCLVFEDSDTGARAGHAAGMTVVQVPDIHPTDGRYAHHVAPTLLQGARAAGLEEPF